MIRLTITWLIGSILATVAPTARAQRVTVPANAKPGGNQVAGPQAVLASIVQAGVLDDLQWPDFSQYREDVASMYRLSEHTMVWLHDGRPTPQALHLIEILQAADSEGLRPEDYDGERWAARVGRLQGQHSPEDEVRFDVALTVSAMRYSSDLKKGRTNPQQFKFALDEGPSEENDLPIFVRERLANGEDLQAELAHLEPPFAGYGGLKALLPIYEQLAKQDDGEKLPIPEKLLYPGSLYPGYQRLGRLLRLLGDLPGSYSVPVGDASKFDLQLYQAVRNFQERHSLAVTGYLDKETVEAMNVPLADRVEQIRLAMERYRWVRHYRLHDLVLVNIPGFHLFAFDERGIRALMMRVEVGEDFNNTRTPVLNDNIEYLVFRPYWDVPFDIQRDEVVPLLADKPDLAAFHYEALSAGGQVVANGRVTPALLEKIHMGMVHIRQRPGPDNPMGLVKFIFPNRYSVYLHDMPLRELAFMLPKGIASHGCIHVEKPAELAAWMLRDQPAWNLSQVQQAMLHGQDNRRVNLSKPLRVVLFYTTASALEHGHPHFYRDIYGYDAELRDALSRGYPQQKSSPAARQ